jgi:hypothetical protein
MLRQILACTAVLAPGVAQAQVRPDNPPKPQWASFVPSLQAGRNADYSVLGVGVSLAALLRRWEIRATLADFSNRGASGCVDDCPTGLRSSGDLALLFHPSRLHNYTGPYVGAGVGWATAARRDPAVSLMAGHDVLVYRPLRLRLEIRGTHALRGFTGPSFVPGLSVYNSPVRQVTVAVGLGWAGSL